MEQTEVPLIDYSLTTESDLTISPAMTNDSTSVVSSPNKDNENVGNRRRRGRKRVQERHWDNLLEQYEGSLDLPDESFEGDDQIAIVNGDNTKTIEIERESQSQYIPPHDSIILFGFDLSGLQSSHQFYVCASGVFGFTLIYAYLQEILSVHIANRQYALFVSTIQLFGYAVWSYFLTKLRIWRLGPQASPEASFSVKDEKGIEMQTLVQTSHVNNEILSLDGSESYNEKESLLVPNISPSKTSGRNQRKTLCTNCMNDLRYEQISKIITYITNEKDTNSTHDKAPLILYIVLSIIRAIDVGMTNTAMKYLNYPAKVMIKSSRIVFTMIFGIFISKKRYKLFDYLMVIMLVFGLGIFLHADRKNDAVFHPLGVLMLVFSLICDATVVNFSEVMMRKYHISQDEYLQSIYSLSFTVILIVTVVKGELFSGIQNFLLRPGTISEINQTLDSYPQEKVATYTIAQKVIVIVLFTFTGLFGSSCAAAITKRFGALTMSITSTTRKAATLFISLALPGLHNKCTNEHVVGMSIFLLALFSKAINKKGNTEIYMPVSGGKIPEESQVDRSHKV